MSAERVLVVEDEEDIAELLRYNLEAAGFSVAVANTGELGLAAASNEPPSIVLLDLMLPTIDGLEVCRRLRAAPNTAAIPIVMLTARGEESDVVRGLEMGADDYVTKPFSPRVLIARIQSVLRRKRSDVAGEEDALRFDTLQIHPGRHEATVAGDKVELTNSEFRILHLLARRPGWVFTRYQIVDGVRGENYPVTERSVDVQIVGLRRKLGEAAAYIETVRGVGYRFKEEG
ncbi:MAG: two-component system alkaline phosphatase synthesis response regulator PhoP [Hyphomicrobiaceae bacterium]|jgi:two-component system alkaline phosphatase synthesis response regulator PhoP